MATFRVTDPQSGRTVKLTGESPPTEQELEQIFSSLGGQQDSATLTTQKSPTQEQQTQLQPATQQQVVQPKQVPTDDFIPTDEALAATAVPEKIPEKDAGFIGAGIVEPLATAVTSAVAQPISGFAGLGTLAFGGSLKDASENIASTQEALTFRPRTESGKEGLRKLGQAVQTGIDLANIPASGIAGIAELISGQGLEQAAETINSVKTKGLGQTLGDRILEETGSPIAATIAQTSPDIALEIIGLKGLSKAKLAETKLSNNVAEAITQASPDIDTIKQAKTAAYNELDNAGIKIKPQIYDKFVDNLEVRLKKEGMDPTLNPKSTAALNRMISDKGTPKTLNELETLRKIAKGAANDIDKTDARTGKIIVDEIDKAVDRLSNQIGGKFKKARSLAQRAFKSEAITDMIENASHTASGLENGLRIEARKILKNPKKRKGFTNDELKALSTIEQGTRAANIAKFLGKFGISEGQATSMLGASIGIGGGGAIGATFSPAAAAVGAVTVPVIAQIAKNTAQKITLNNAKFSDDLVRAGGNAKEITRAYLRNTPKADRSVSDLTDLLTQTDLDAKDIKNLAKSRGPTGKFIADSVFFANEIKRRAQQVGSAALITQPELQQEE